MEISHFIQLTRFVHNDCTGDAITYDVPGNVVTLHFTDLVPGSTLSYDFTTTEIADYFLNGHDAAYIVGVAVQAVEQGICDRCSKYDQYGQLREVCDDMICESCFDDMITSVEMSETYDSLRGRI